MRKLFQLKPIISHIIVAVISVAISLSSVQADERESKIREKVEPFIEQVIIQSLISETMDVIQRMTKQANIGIRPDFVYPATQQGVLQVFQHESTLGIIRRIYADSLDLAVDQFTSGRNPAEVQDNVLEHIKNDLKQLHQEYVYQQIVETVIKFAYQTQQKVIMQHAMQQYVQQALTKKNAMKQEIQQQYREAVVNSLLVQ